MELGGKSSHAPRRALHHPQYTLPAGMQQHYFWRACACVRAQNAKKTVVAEKGNPGRWHHTLRSRYKVLMNFGILRVTYRRLYRKQHIERAAPCPLWWYPSCSWSETPRCTWRWADAEYIYIFCKKYHCFIKFHYFANKRKAGAVNYAQYSQEVVASPSNDGCAQRRKPAVRWSTALADLIYISI